MLRGDEKVILGAFVCVGHAPTEQKQPARTGPTLFAESAKGWPTKKVSRGCGTPPYFCA
jgi:hypothetical protein